MDMSEDEFADIDKFVAQKCLLRPVITAQNLCSIYQCPDQQMYRARIQFLFELDSYVDDDEQRDALIDMIHGAILFACDNDFSYPKAIVFLTIYVVMFQMALEMQFYLPDQLHKRYEDILLAHAIDRAPRANQIFELADVKLINEFFVNTFFRQLKLIMYVFTQKQFVLFRAQDPVHVPAPELPALASMEMVRPEKPEEEQPKPAEPQGKSKSPRSPKQQTMERTLTKKHEAPPPPPEPEPEVDEGPEDRGPEVPLDLLRGTLQEMHQKFVQDFEEKEKQIIGKIKEREIRIQQAPPPPPKKAPPPRKK